MPITFSPSDKTLSANTNRLESSNEILINRHKKGNEKYNRFYDKSVEKLPPSPPELLKSSLETQQVHCKHGLIFTALEAYSKHHHLVLRPDDFWTALLVQFSLFIDNRAEEFRQTFVDFEGKKELIIGMQGTLRTCQYDSFVLLMLDKIQANIKDPKIKEWITADFSTSTYNDQVANSIALMSTLKSYFDYTCMLMCGLPRVTLEGEVEDWLKLREKVEKFNEYQDKEGVMNKWLSTLVPVIDKLVETSQGKIDNDFWNKIAYETSLGSGSNVLTGWIVNFCAFNHNGRYQLKPMGMYEYPPDRTNKDKLYVDIDSVTSGLCQAPVKIIDLDGTEYSSIIYSGQVGYSKHDDNETIKPETVWGIILDNN